MLVIGDLALNQINSAYPVNSIEIITDAEHVTYLEQYFKVIAPERTINRFTKRYRLKSGKPLIIYNANDFGLVLMTLLEQTFAKGLEFKYASPSLLFEIACLKVEQRHDNVYDWQKAVQDFNILWKSEMLYYHQKDNRALRNFQLKSIKYYTFVIADYNIDTSVYLFNGFNYWTEESLHDVYRLSSLGFLHFSEGGRYSYRLNKSKWDKATLITQQNAILERAYVIALNDFIIPIWEDKGNVNPSFSFRDEFVRALMMMVAEADEEWLRDFIVFNYSDLMKSFNPNYGRLYENAKQFNELIKVED